MTGPMTPEQAAAAALNMMTSAAACGVWNKICNRCGACVGGRLAEYGEPSAEDLSCCACPHCGASARNGGTFRAELDQPTKEPV